jgi:hypothetical protein
MHAVKLLIASALALASGSAAAGLVPVTSVPVDSPWALAGLAAILAVVGARLIRNRRK